MKKGLLFMAIAALVGFSACDKVAELVDFGIPMTFEENLSVAIADADSNIFEDVMIIDASGNQEVKDNIANIANFDISKVSYKVTSFTGDDAITADGFVQFFNDQGNIGDPVNTGLIEFKAMVDSGEEVEIPVSDDLRIVLEEKLLSDQVFSMKMYGTVSGKPMTADLTVIVVVEAKVKF